MKIFCVNSKKFLAVFLLFIGCLFLISSSPFLSSLEVFKTDRLLPIYNVETSEPKVAITFDCAWGSDDIPDILKTLKDNDVKATFFMVGKWAEKYPDSVRKIIADGHDIGNHSYTHAHLNSLDFEQIKKEITDANTVFKNITGKDCILFRTPYGEYNDKVIKAGNETGQYTIQWNIDSLDWKGLSADEITNRILKKLENGAIILLHNDTENTYKALPNIISGIKDKGFSIVPTSELIIKENYYIDHAGKQIKE